MPEEWKLLPQEEIMLLDDKTILITGGTGSFGKCFTDVYKRQALNAVSLFFMFLILFAVAASRLNVGNDYAKYVEFMHLTYCNAYVPTEVGFNLLTKAIYGISGFENYLLVFAIFAFFTVLLFLQAIYRQAESFGFSFFLFMAFGYYFQSFSTCLFYTSGSFC